MTGAYDGVRAVSFDLFGTLLSVSVPEEPAVAVADELAARGVAVPKDWEAAYRETHLDRPQGAETPLPDHVAAALASRHDADPSSFGPAADRAVRAAFDPDVRTRPDATRAVETVAERLPVAVLSNCSVPGLAERALKDSAVDDSQFETVVTSVSCGWRKPDPRAFEAVAEELGVDPVDLLHVGDDPETDGGASEASAGCLLVPETSLDELANRFVEGA